MTKSKKTILYLCLISTLSIIASLIITPWLNFFMNLIIYVLAPGYIILMLLARKYVKKDLIFHSPRRGKVTARTIFIVAAFFPIMSIFFLVEHEVGPTSFNITALILWSFSSIINLIAAIIYKPPQEKQQKSIF